MTFWIAVCGAIRARPTRELTTSFGAAHAARRPMGSDRKIRYPLVGAGNIAQVAVLPAFAHAEKVRAHARQSAFAQTPKPRRVGDEGDGR